MGMSASQVRFLSLQHRKHDVGRQLTTLSNRKLSLSRDMNRIAKNYTNAMNQNVLRWSNDSGITYHDLTYDTLMSPNKLNAAKPYLVTDAATGRVVLNNDQLLDLEGEPLKDEKGKVINISYVDIAKKISTYSGMDTVSNKPVYYPESKCIHVGTDGVTMGDKAIDGAYVIPDTTREFTFDNSLRFEIFKAMGLISDKDVIEQTSLLTKLYGGVEAQKTGVYPIGSAWGNYYIALANLDAYEDFLSHEQSLATAFTYTSVTNQGGDKDSNNINACFKDSSALYDYKADVVTKFPGYGDEVARSTIEQTVRPEGNQSVKHVDFSQVVKMQSDGTWSAVDSAGTEADEYMFDMCGYDANYVEFVSKVNDTKDGIVYKYVLRDVLTDALDNYQAGNSAYIDALIATGTTHDVIVLDKQDDESYLTEDYKNECRRSLEDALRDFIGLMKGAKLAQYSDEALNNAAAKTRELYKENFDRTTRISEWTFSYGPVRDAAEKNSIGYLGFGTGRKPEIFCGWFGGSDSYVQTRLDVKTLFNVFMSYVNYYTVNAAEAGLEDLSVSCATYVDSGVNPDYTMSSANYDDKIRQVPGSDLRVTTGTGNISGHGYAGDYYFRAMFTEDLSQKGLPDIPKYYVNYATGDKVEAGSAQLQRYVPVTTTTVDAEGNNILQTISDPSGYLGYKWELKPPTGLPSYYTIYEYDGKKDKLTTPVNSSGYIEYEAVLEENAYGWNPSIPWTAPGSGIQISGVYGLVLQRTADSLDTYYITNSSEWNAYKAAVASGNSATPLLSLCPSAQLYDNTSSGPAGLNQVIYQEREASTYREYNDTYEVILNSFSKDSRFDIRSYAMVYDNEQIHQELRDAVQEAKDYIDELETELADFYGAKESKLMDFYDALFKNIAENGWMIDDRTSRSRGTVANDYLNGRLQNNDYFVTVVEQSADSRDYDYLTRQAVNVTKIFQVHDEDAENVALSEYEAEKSLISSKERVIDARMRKLETEQEVINTELDSIKQIIKDNVDKTFKIFA